MISYLKEGWRAAVRQPFLLLTLFLYRFAWGLALYKMIQSVMLPLLHRYPGSGAPETQIRLFLAEGQFRLFKTDISHPYLWLLLWLLVLKLVLTPLLNAGILYSLSNVQYNAGYRFFRGIKELWRPYALYYFLQLALTFTPLYWVLPKAGGILATAVSYRSIASGLAPYLAGMLAYGFLIHLLFLYIQFGRVWGNPAVRTLNAAGRNLPAILGIALLVLVLTTLLTAAAVSASLLWAGFWALVLYQGYRFVHTLFNLWGIAAQHQLYKAKTDL